jgi:collagenase-like PrtC family protease
MLLQTQAHAVAGMQKLAKAVYAALHQCNLTFRRPNFCSVEQCKMLANSVHRSGMVFNSACSFLEEQIQVTQT